MKKLILLSVLAFIVSSCGYEIRKIQDPPKPKLTKEQIRKQEYEQKLKDYDVKFLFECNGVKVYRFYDSGNNVYFTNANGTTSYQRHIKGYTTHIKSINTKK